MSGTVMLLIAAAACFGYVAGAWRVQIIKAQRDALEAALAKLAGLPPRSRRLKSTALIHYRAHQLKAGQ